MQNSSIKKYAIGLVLVAAFVAYIVFANKNSSTAAVTNPTPSATGTDTSSGSTGSGSTASTGQYKDGTYTSPVADAFYGKLQIAVVVKGGAITDVTFPTYPKDNPETAHISGGALQILKQETITAQSANVNIVSGATQTSQAYQQALASVLTQAKA